MKDIHRKEGYYSRLYRNFIFLILVSSLIPHLIVGWGIYLYFSNFSNTRLKETFQNQVEDHRKIIELFLKERTSDLGLVARTHSLEYLSKQENLGKFHKDSGIEIVDGEEKSSRQSFPRSIVAYAWLKEPRWLLVVKQDYSEAFGTVNRANWSTLIFLHLSSLGIIILTVVVTYLIIKMIQAPEYPRAL